jgi:YVTN family beta-propeller protein
MLGLTLSIVSPLVSTEVHADSLIGTIPVGQGPYGAVYDPDNARIYVANYDEGSVSVIDAHTNSVVATIANVGVNPRELAYNSNNKLVYVANTNFGQPSGSVAVIDPSTNQVIKVITASIGRNPTGIAYDSIHNKLYITNQLESFVSVIDGSTNNVIRTIGGIQNPYTDVFNPSNGKVYVTTALGVNQVYVIDPATDTVIKSIPVGSDPIFAAYDSTNHDIYVANQFSNNVYVIDDTTNQVTSIIPAGTRPVGVAHDPTNNKIYVANSASDDITIIDGSTNQPISTIPSGGDTPATPVYSSVNQLIYVTIQLSNYVSIFNPNPQPPSPPSQTTITSAIDGNGVSVQNGGSTVSKSITFQVTATQGSNPIASFECSLDSSQFSTCGTNTNPTTVSYNNLAAGQQHTFKVRAVDTQGNKDPTPATFTWTILTPSQAVQNIISTIDNMHLSHGTTTSLEAPLNNAIKQLNRNHDVPICNLLNAFLDQVNQKQAGGQLTPQQAANLRQQATAIETSLGCSASTTMTTATNNNNQESPSSTPSSIEKQQEQSLINLRNQAEHDALSSITK